MRTGTPGELLARLGVIGKSFEHDIEMTGLLACCNSCAIQLRKGLRELGEAVCQCVAFHDPRTYPEKNALGTLLVVLLSDGEQCLFEWQSGLRQRGELSCYEGELPGR